MPPSDLRESVLRAATEYVAKHGPDGLSIRQVANDAGVSHQAPYHHFGDRGAIFAAIAIEGFQGLSDAMTSAIEKAAPSERALAIGEAYVEFALRRRGHFRVMFRDDLCSHDDPELRKAADAAFEILLSEARHVAGPRAPEDETRLRAITMWSVAHGLASLLIDGPIHRKLGTLRNQKALIRGVLESAALPQSPRKPTTPTASRRTRSNGKPR